jgi:hypothetical protein
VPESSRDLRIAAALFAAFLLLTLPFLYRDAFGEADAGAVAIGIQQAVLGGRGLSEPLLYVPSGHPLYYAIFTKWSGATDLAAVKAVMDRISLLSMAGSVALVYLVARRFARLPLALGATLAVASSPVVFELGTYGHPITPALFFFVLGAYLLVLGAQRGVLPDLRGGLLLGGSAIALGVSASLRSDVLFFFSALLALAHAARPDRRGVGAAAIAGVGGAGIYFVAKNLLPHSPAAGRGLVQQLVGFLANNYDVKHLLYGFAAFLFALGPGLSLALFATLALLARKRAWWPLAYGACLILPTTIFFLGNPHPSRHFLHAIVGAGFFLAIGFAHLFPAPAPRRWLFAPAVIALNLGLASFGGLLLRASGKSLGCTQVSAKCWLATHLTEGVFDRHRINQRYHGWDRERWERVLAARPGDGLLIGTWTELVGLRFHVARQGKRITLKQTPYGRDSEWQVLWLGDLKLYFWMRSPLARTDPAARPPGPIYLLAPFPAEDMAKLPRGIVDAPAWVDAFEAL